MYGDKYFEAVTETINRVRLTQADKIKEAAAKLADTVERKSTVFVFGASHAGILAEELFYRTGGLAIVNPIMFPGLTLDTRPITLTSTLERQPGLGKIILEANRLKKGDFLLLHSVSGRNTVAIEMAIEAAKIGVETACITNLAYSKSVSSRHPDGKKLYEVCGTVIDNCGLPGDISVEIPGLGEKMGPTSTAAGAAIVNAIAIEATEALIARGTVPPVFLSANLPGGDAHNRKIFEEYGENIRYE